MKIPRVYAICLWVVILAAVTSGCPVIARTFNPNRPPKPAKLKKLKETGKNPTALDPQIKWYDDGVDKFKAGNIDGAIDSFLQSVYFARNNFSPDSWGLLGVCYKLKHEDSKAIEALKKCIEQKMIPNPDAYCELGELYMRNGREPEAEHVFETALVEAKGPCPRGHYCLGTLFEQQKQYDVAIDHYRMALGRKPWWYTDAWMGMASCDLKTGQFIPALNLYLGLLTNAKHLKNVNLPLVHFQIALCCLGKGNHEGALQNLHAALAYNPDYADAHFALARMLDADKHLSAALEEFREYLRCAPPSDEKKVQDVKDRIVQIEQQLKPGEAGPTAAKPSPYMRKQRQQAIEAQRQAEARARDAIENGGGETSQSDSGF